jgi:acyl carrier protein
LTQVEHAVKQFIQTEFLRDRPDFVLANDEPLIQTGIIDSLGIFLLIGYLEEQLGVKIEPQDVVLENFETVDTIVALVNLRGGANAAQSRLSAQS